MATPAKAWPAALAAGVIVAISCVPGFADAAGESGPECATRARLFTSELAAVSALALCYGAVSIDEDREYMAAVLRQPDGFRFVVQPSRRGRDRVELRFGRYSGEVLAALWHTHGRLAGHRSLFSPTDTDLVAAVAVPLYLSDPRGVLRVLRPGVRARIPRRGHGLPPPRGSATGAVVRSQDATNDASQALTASLE